MTITALLIAVAIANLFLGLIVYLRKSTSLLHYSFLLITIGVAVWGLGIAAFLSPEVTDGLIYYINAYYAAALLIATALYGFSVSLRGQVTRRFVHGAFMLGLPLAYMLVTTLVPEAVLSVDETTREVTLHLVAYTLYGVVFSAVFITACVRLARFAYKHTGRRYRLVSISILFAGLIGILFNLILPALGNYSHGLGRLARYCLSLH